MADRVLTPGTELGGTYRITAQIGSGGGGIIYRARHLRLNTDVVVKQLKERVQGYLNERAEADVLKNLKHPRLPRVYDFIEEGGAVYTVMDFIPGASMDKVLKRAGRFPQRDVYRWTLQLADALSYLHAMKPPVVHSDIKPANIMLMPDGNICLIDFNISLAFNRALRTSTGVSLGYSPPEQYHDFASYLSRVSPDGTPPPTLLKVVGPGAFGIGIDERSDIYSLGATLYHFLTGHKPQVNYGEIVPLSWYDIELGEGFRVILEKMLNLNPALRFRNGGELKEALENIREYDSEYRAYRRKERGRIMILTGMLISGLALTGTGFFTMRRERLYTYNREVARAEELIEAERFREAGETLLNAEKLHPDRVEAYRTELLRLYRMGEYDEAIKYGRDILENPAYVLNGEKDAYELGAVLDILGNAYYETGDYPAAAACFEQAVDRNGDSAAFYRDYAAALAFAGDPEKAAEVLEEAEEHGLKGIFLRMTRGELAYVKGDYPEAEAAFAEVLGKGDPDSPEERVMLRRALLFSADAAGRTGDWGKAAELLRSFSSVSGVFGIPAEEKLAESCYRQAAALKDTDPAASASLYEESLERFLSLKEKGILTDVLLENLATVYEQTGRLPEAEQTLLEFADLCPGDYRPYKRLALLEADRQQSLPNGQRNYENMLRYYREAVRLLGEAEGRDDPEMQVLESMIRTLDEGRWFREMQTDF